MVPIFEGDTASDVVDQQSSRGTAIVGAYDRTEAILTCGIPDLQLAVGTFDLKSLGTEFHANSYLVVIAVALIGELQQNACFADGFVADDDKFEQVTIVIVCRTTEMSCHS